MWISPMHNILKLHISVRFMAVIAYFLMLYIVWISLNNFKKAMFLKGDSVLMEIF